MFLYIWHTHQSKLLYIAATESDKCLYKYYNQGILISYIIFWGIEKILHKIL